jgi:hypothetical protein
VNKKIITLIFTLATTPLYADEISDSLRDALKAYEDGDLKETSELMSYVTTLLAEKNANVLAGFLPEAPSGWSRELDDGAATSGAMASLGQGGSIASAKYKTDLGGDISYMIMADSPMMAMMGAMLANPALMGGGKVKRIKRQKVLIGKEGELQAMLHNRFVIRIEPDNKDVSEEDLIILFEATDVDGLQGY